MNYQNYIISIIIVAFFVYKYLKFRTNSKKIPLLLENGAVIIDVRSSNEFASGHNPISQNIPLDQLNTKIKNLNQEKTYILCCASGTRSEMAVNIMKKSGFKNVLNAGGWRNTLQPQ